MAEDTTLDAFRDGEPETEDEPDAESAVPTASWSADPVECPRCGEAVQRRFRAEDGTMVCPTCKRW